MGKYKGFTSVELKRPGRSTFDLSHEKRISSRIGKLTPVFISETMPNDTFYGSTEVLIKLAPLIAPIYHRLNLYVHYFFIPNRLLWTDWEPFITGGRLGAEVTTPPVPPNFDINAAQGLLNEVLNVGSIADYLGVPPIEDADTGSYIGATFDYMPWLAYYRCWYDYYRDRNFIADNTLLPMASGLNDVYNELLEGKYRCWEHDYFTSAQTTTQRGAEVLMPLQGTGTVNYSSYTSIVEQDGGLASAGHLETAGGAVAPVNVVGDAEALQFRNIDSVNITNSDVSINDLRRAVALQTWLERNQLAGSRYNESIMAHFGRKTSDSRLQRAEYLGGGKAVIQISEVMTTAYSEDSMAEVVPPGNQAGRGSAYADTNRFSYNCEEHGFVIGILSVLPSSGYMQGLPRMFRQRNTFLEYPWPSFAHLGEQEVYDYEIMMTNATLTAARVSSPLFGYQSRYSDWKHIASSSHGDFRTTLDFWHMTRLFSAVPTLGNDFVTFEDALQDRVFNVSGVDTLWMYVYNKITVKRSLPYFGTPQLN